MDKYYDDYLAYLEEVGLTEDEYTYNEFLKDIGDDIKYEYYLRGDLRGEKE